MLGQGLLDAIEAELQQEQDTPAAQAVRSAAHGNASLSELLTGIRHGWPEGQRNNGLLSVAGLLRARGLSGEVIYALLESVNRSTGMNLSVAEINGITRSIQRYTPKPENRPCSASDILTVEEAGRKWRELRKRGQNCRTGYTALDASLPYFQAGEVFTIAGRSGTCKTTAGLQIGGGIARHMGGFCLFVSLEMDASAVYFRLSNIRLSETRGEAIAAETTAHELDKNPNIAEDVNLRFNHLLIVDKDSLPVEKIEEHLIIAREKVLERGEMSVVVIDYMGYIRDIKNGSTYERVSRIAREIKALAKRQQVRIVLLCQTSREGKDGTEPVQLWHLRDSGAIEESADYVLGIWHSKSEETRLHCEVLKARHSPRGARFDFINQGLHLVEAEYKPESSGTASF